MNDKLETYTSTGSKLIHHTTAVSRLKFGWRGTPVSVQIAPTSKCNLQCSFCSNVNRENHESLDPAKLKDLISELQTLGAKTVEWTGGGDPTMYEHINDLMTFCESLNLKQGFITNGVALKKNILPENLNRLKWVRISMNCLDYVDDIEIPDIPGTLGFSYVMNEKTSLSILARLQVYVEKVNPAYVRIVPNCQASDEEQDENNRKLGEEVLKWSAPYFYQPKTFHKPDKCYWGYFKPFILHDGWVYPCSSVVLNADAERSFHDKYRWVKMAELPSVYRRNIRPNPTENCNHCVFSEQNAMVDNLLDPSGMEDFI